MIIRAHWPANAVSLWSLEESLTPVSRDGNLHCIIGLRGWLVVAQLGYYLKIINNDIQICAE